MWDSGIVGSRSPALRCPRAQLPHKTCPASYILLFLLFAPYFPCVAYNHTASIDHIARERDCVRAVVVVLDGAGGDGGAEGPRVDLRPPHLQVVSGQR